MTYRACVSLGAAVVMLAAGCVSVPDFEQQSIVAGPRVLAIVANPPAVAPGQDSELSLLLAGFDEDQEYSVRWSVCGGFFTQIMGSQYGDQPQSKGCAGTFSQEIEGRQRARVPGALTEALFDNLDVAAAVLGSALPPGTVDLVRDEVGLPLLVEATIEMDGMVLRAVKRILVTRGARHHNPPPPHFDLDGQQVVVSGDPDEPFRCVLADSRGRPQSSEEAATVCVSAARELELAPLFEKDSEDAEAWLEDYQVLNARGELVDRTERAFYSWFATGGHFDQNVTKSPLRNELWRTPGQPQERESLWLVVRDGHGGASACGIDVMVSQDGC